MSETPVTTEELLALISQLEPFFNDGLQDNINHGLTSEWEAMTVLSNLIDEARYPMVVTEPLHDYGYMQWSHGRQQYVLTTKGQAYLDKGTAAECVRRLLDALAALVRERDALRVQRESALKWVNAYVAGARRDADAVRNSGATPDRELFEERIDFLVTLQHLQELLSTPPLVAPPTGTSSSDLAAEGDEHRD